MKKSRKAPLIVSYVLIGLLLVGAIALLVVQTALNGWVIDPGNAAKCGLVIIGLGITLVKLISKTGGGVSLRKYESAYRKEIGSAFSAPDQKKHKRSLLQAAACYNENQYKSAINRLTALRKVCRTNDDYNAVLLFLALSYSDADMTDDAIAVYEELVKFSPSHSRAWSNLGFLYEKKGMHSRGIECYESALKHDDGNAYAWNNLAQAYLASGNWKDVIAPAERSLAIKANMYQAENALTIAYFAMGETEKSREHFDRAVLHGSNAANLASVLNSMAHGTAMFGDTSRVRDEVVRANGHLQRDTALPMVEIRLPAPDDGNRSRLGGAPVDPSVLTDSAGRPMKLLAAIWCSEVRGVPDFPTRGVLRFYVADNDLYGADFDHPTVQSDFRVLYDEQEDGFDTELRDDPSISPSFPIQHAQPVRLTPAMSSVRATDYRFEECVNAALRKADLGDDMDSLSDAECDYLYEQNVYAGHRIGGYPCFEQTDPRDGRPDLQRYDTLLLQIVSHSVPDGHGGEQHLIMFGDEGGCQFFIPQDKLRARDFSDVLYSWDCG